MNLCASLVDVHSDSTVAAYRMSDIIFKDPTWVILATRIGHVMEAMVPRACNNVADNLNHDIRLTESHSTLPVHVYGHLWL